MPTGNPLIDLLDQTVDAMKKAADQEQQLNDVAMAYLGITSKTTPEVNRLVAEMKKQDDLNKKAEGQDKKTGNAFLEMQKAALSFTAAAAITAAGMRKFAQSSSPELVGALGTSMELLSAKIGGELQPVLDFAIDATQDLADWFDTLTAGEKKLTASLVIGVPAVTGLAFQTGLLTPAAKAAAAGVRELWKAAAARPKLSMAVGGTAAVAGIATAVVMSIEQFKKNDGAAYGHDHSQNAGTAKRVTEEEFKEGTVHNKHHNARWDRLRSLPDDQRKAEASRMAADLRAKADKGEKDWFTPQSFVAHQRDMAEMYERAGTYGLASHGESKDRKAIHRQAQRTAAATRENAPHYSGFAEARKQLQLQILGKNPFEQKLLAEQRKHRVDEIKELKRLVTLFEKNHPGANFGGD